MKPWLDYLVSIHSSTPLVLLHASWPYCRQAAWLASLYPFVYVDIGLAIPLLSVDGMKQTISSCLELVPTTKLLYSSDAHVIPELFIISCQHIRLLLTEVLSECMLRKEINEQFALEIAINILHNNAINLYNLNAHSRISISQLQPSSPTPSPLSSIPKHGIPLTRFMWVGHDGVRRCKTVLSSALQDPTRCLLSKGIGLVKACMSLPVHQDAPAPHSGLGPCGDVRLVPDMQSLTALPFSPSQAHSSVMCNLYNSPMTPWSLCPRSFLLNQINALETLGFTMLVGHEIECTFLRSSDNEYVPLDNTNYAQT